MKIFTNLLKRHFLAILRGSSGVVLLASVACSSNPADGQWIGDEVTNNDFESVPGWGWADRTTITRDHAHSGRYAVVVDQHHATGIMFDLPVYEATVQTLAAVEVDAWVYLPNDKADAVLRMELLADGADAQHPLYGEELALLSQVSKFKTWSPVHQIFHLPAGTPGNTHLRLFLKRGTSTEPVYLDDIRVRAREW